MCFRKFWDPKMFKNPPPDRLWGYFLYQTASKNHARLTGRLRIVRKPQNLTDIDPKIFPGRATKTCRVGKNKLWYPLESELFHFSKESGLNSSSKFLRSRNESTRVSGFVLIRLGARAMNFFSRKLLKSQPPRRRGITRGLLGIPWAIARRTYGPIRRGDF